MDAAKELDIVVVGAGFGGLYITHRFKDAGFRVECLEKAPSHGGVWHWNCYPGARVDSRYPVYQFTDPKVSHDWTWKEAFPGHEEIRAYLDHVIDRWNLAGSITCHSDVSEASFDEESHRWTVRCADGRVLHARWVINALGFATQPYLPKIEGVHDFAGPSFHSARWPQQGIDVRGKRVAIIGTGASAVQIIQTIASEVGELVVYQRTPSVCLPMRQQALSKAFQDQYKASGDMDATMRRCKYEKFGGQDVRFVASRWAQDSDEQRLQVLEAAWEKGGFHPLLSTYFDAFVDPKVNAALWRFWAQKCRARIAKPKYRDLLAPLDALHAFGGKRTPMEQNYFEAFNRPNVKLVDTLTSPITRILPSGIETAKEGVLEFDIVVFATGFDTNTGALTAIDIRDTAGESLKSRWANGVHTQFGLSTSRFPNMFNLYGPQAPTAFSNGPSCVEIQGEYIFDLVEDMTRAQVTRVETLPAAEQAWRQSTLDIWAKFVFSSTKGFYTGANVEGKAQEPLNWFGGFPAYHAALKKSRESGYEGYAKASLYAKRAKAMGDLVACSTEAVGGSIDGALLEPVVTLA